jgi:hypothetical protein
MYLSVCACECLCVYVVVCGCFRDDIFAGLFMLWNRRVKSRSLALSRSLFLAHANTHKSTFARSLYEIMHLVVLVYLRDVASVFEKK